MMKKLPIGIQTFSEIINNDYLYIDKTQHIHKLLDGKYYFLSRPRRFGKSLTLSTLENIFLGNKELFKGLWIYDKIDWKSYPVIKISFANIGYVTMGLVAAIEKMLSDIAKTHQIELESTNYSQQFQELIRKLSKKGQVVILIDEYDKPIIDYITDIEQAEKNRAILKEFYTCIKDNDQYIKFFFLTGVSKFSRVSIFSDLNHLNDITIDSNYSQMVGYTQDELYKYFAENIDKLAVEYKEVFPDIKQTIKKWYNGYSWDGVNFVYNPFSILNLFSKNQFDNYWFKSGTPTFLTQLIKNNHYTPLDLENREIDPDIFDKYEITKITLYSLMFQTGYLTIKSRNIADGSVILDYPNQEVSKSFSYYLLAELNDRPDDQTGTLIKDIERAVKNNEIENLISHLKLLFANITYPNIDSKEKYYHSIFYLTLKLLGYNIQSEVITLNGRIDVVMQTATNIYVIEFKVGKAKAAIQQIKDKQYHLKYTNDKKQIVLLGIGFDLKKKNIGSWEMELV